MAKLTSVIFDLEGTLIDGLVDFAGAVNVVLQRHGRGALPLETLRPMMTDGMLTPMQKALAATGSMPPDIIPMVQEAVQHYRTAPADHTCLLPGAVATLDTLRARGLKLGLCTNKPDQATRKLLKELDLEDRFTAVAGGDTFMVHKPHPDHILELLKLMDASVSETVMVGDGSRDFLAAKRAGVPCIAVGQETDPSVAAQIKGVAELPACLEKIGFTF